MLLVPTHSYSQGSKEYLMRAHFGIPSVTSEETEGKPPIQVKFEIPYFTTSGIQVKKKPSYAIYMRCRQASFRLRQLRHLNESFQLITHATLMFSRFVI